jgi:hypothetical protein
LTLQIETTTWVYVLVQNPGQDEQIVGQIDEELRISFIPTFLEKDTAQEGMLSMPREKGSKYEIQAIIYEDLVRYAAGNEFLIFVLDGEGKILDRIAP